jgi:hypothetical protein
MSVTRPSAVDPSGTARGRERHKPQLSIVLLSTGSRGDLERAANVLIPIVRAVRGQLVIVRDEAPPALLQTYVDSGVINFLRMPRGTERDGMAQAAMSLVRGDIVAIREDANVRDVEWLTPYRHALHLDDIVADRPSHAINQGDATGLAAEPRGVPETPTLLEGTSGA